MEGVQLHVVSNGVRFSYPVSDYIKEMIEWKIKNMAISMSSYVVELIDELAYRNDVPPTYDAIKELARRDDRDVRGYLDDYFRRNCKMKSMEFLKMSLADCVEYIKFARKNPAVAATWCINAMLVIYEDYDAARSSSEKLNARINLVKRKIKQPFP